MTRFITILALSLLLAMTSWAQDSLPVVAGEVPVDATLRRGEAYYHVIRAQLAARRGRFLEVLRELREATALEPDSAGLHAEAGSLLLQLGQRTEAKRMAKRALEIDSESRVALRVLADLATSRAASPHGGDSGSRDRAMKEAIGLYEKLASFPDADEEVLLVLARLKLGAGDQAGAIKLARRLLAQRPGNSLSVRLLAQALLQDRQSSRALRVMLEHMVSNPGDREIALMVEELALQSGEWEPVEKAFARIVEERPELAIARRLLGEALFFMDRPLGAIPQLEEAVEMDPSDPSVRLNLAKAYWRVHRLADATETSMALAEEYPNAIQVRWVLGGTLTEQRDVEGALDAFSSALEILDRAPAATRSQQTEQRDQLRLRMAALMLNHERPNDALEILSDLETPDRTDSSQLRGRAWIQSGATKQARSLAKRLRSEKAEGAAALIEGEALLHEGEVARAVGKFKEAIHVLGSSARNRVDRVLQDAGHKGAAEGLLQEWVETDPEDPDARFALGGFLDREGRHAEAETELRRVLELDPGHAWALNHLGYSMADRNVQLDEALKLIRRALVLDPWNGAYLDSLGWVYFRMGRFQDARDPLERAAREYPRDPTVLDHLGDLYQSLGEPEAALSAWQRALDSGPENPEALTLKLQEADRKLGAQKNPSENPAPDPLPPR